MHRKGIIHRDIKADNILILDKSESKICITDLGLACMNNDLKHIFTKCGTPGFVAPEVLKKGGRFTTRADIFSIGSLLYQLIVGRHLYIGRNYQEVLSANLYQNPIPNV